MTSNAIGALRQRVTIERPVRTSGPGGSATLAWQRHALAFANVMPVSGREISISHGVAGRTTHKVIIRHRADVLPEMRITWGVRHLEILAVLDIESRQRRLLCLCEERLP